MALSLFIDREIDRANRSDRSIDTVGDLFDMADGTISPASGESWLAELEGIKP